MQNDIMSTLAESPFTDNPVNWIKWGFVLATLIFSYIILFKIDKKVSYKLDIERKVEKAKARGHVLQGKLVNSRESHREEWGNGERRHYSGKYEYSLNGKTKYHSVRFYPELRPPIIINLYYVDSPSKLFSTHQRSNDPLIGILHLISTFGPWLIAALVMVLLGLGRNM